jgi:hypothetical protein
MLDLSTNETETATPASAPASWPGIRFGFLPLLDVACATAFARLRLDALKIKKVCHLAAWEGAGVRDVSWRGKLFCAQLFAANFRTDE